MSYVLRTSSITAAILGIVISMNVYALNQRRHHNSSSIKDTKRIRMENTGTTATSSPISSLFSGSSQSILSTACASCSSSLGLVLTSIFGTGLGVSVSTLLSNYQTLSVLILLWSWYSISKSLSTKSYCLLPSKRTPTNNDS